MSANLTPPNANVGGEHVPEDIAERFAPVLVLWPEIPALSDAPESLRDQYARERTRSASRATSGAHIMRDFHPRDVRLILAHAQAWEPRAPLPLVPIGFVRLYRDFARFFFWLVAAAVIMTLLSVALAQEPSGATRDSVEIGALVFLGAIYLVTLRSPILAPVDLWHHLNHVIVAAGLAATWLVTFGSGDLWYVAPALGAPSLVLLITSLMIWSVGGFAASVVWPLRWLRSLMLWMLNRRAHLRPHLHESRVFQGVKPAHEYTDEGELFFRHPRGGKPLHRTDRRAFWSSYSRILGQQGDRYPVTCYARVLEPNDEGLTAIQYWYCYYYNDWANEHEADWESALVLLRGGTPVAMGASMHEGGELRDWRHVELRDGRPVLYVAAGSHAFFFQPGSYMAEREVAGLRITSADAALFGKDVMAYVDFAPGPAESVTVDDVKLVRIPDPSPVTGLWGHDDHDPNCQGDCPYNFEWLNYDGHWGSVGVSLTGGVTSPRGPAASALIWDNPYLWAKTVCRSCSECGDEKGFALV